MKNPFTLLDKFLADYASPRTRRLVHLALALGLLVLSAVLAADGDWEKALISLAATLYAAVNKANTPAVTEVDLQQDDAETYEEAGGQPFPEDPGTALS
jgi:hypothetical protein